MQQNKQLKQGATSQKLSKEDFLKAVELAVGPQLSPEKEIDQQDNQEQQKSEDVREEAKQEVTLSNELTQQKSEDVREEAKQEVTLSNELTCMGGLKDVEQKQREGLECVQDRQIGKEEDSLDGIWNNVVGTYEESSAVEMSKNDNNSGGEEEEDEVAVEEGDTDKLSILDTLTGCPKPDDIILFALPVCAPYNIFNNYKYKIKVQPGNQKKGKAAREAVEVLLRGTEVLDREREVIKAVGENELTTTLVPSVKLSLPGLTKLKQNEKQKKKHNKK
eukprot:TRINITY_DN7284_c0_g1_i13.p3 TRINITY_DN7284_c0_g1~~TRINITY_DN7284_c0_g1_i13.p3  ORF type:complete len:276 (+),score=57.89 TRINITY_DN7284_c0_g1_i13:817-1644(+)